MLPSGRSLLEEALLDRLPYPFLDQSLGRVRYACAVGSELGQLVQVLPSCEGKCYRSAVRVGHAQSSLHGIALNESLFRLGKESKSIHGLLKATGGKITNKKEGRPSWAAQ